MPNKELKIALTGFMGVGKSSVARHLSQILRCRRVDLDNYIERSRGRTIADIVDLDGIDRFREIETACLESVLRQDDATILSLGGGTFTIERNRQLLQEHSYTTVWLESSFEHCWTNVSFSKKDRPLARDKKAAERLFLERQNIYCLADWHFIVKPGSSSFDLARGIADQIFSRG